MNDQSTSSLKQALQALVDSDASVGSLLLATPDGRCLHALMRQAEHRSKVAAMASSLLAIGEKMSHVEGTGACRQVMIQGEAGYATVRRLSQELVLVLTTDKSSNLGYLGHFARKCEQIIIGHARKGDA